MSAGERNAGVSTGRGEDGARHTVATETLIHAAPPGCGTEGAAGRGGLGGPAGVVGRGVDVRGVDVRGVEVGALALGGTAVVLGCGSEAVPRGAAVVGLVLALVLVGVDVTEREPRGCGLEQPVSTIDQARAAAATAAANLRLTGGSTRRSCRCHRRPEQVQRSRTEGWMRWGRGATAPICKAVVREKR